MRTEKIDRDEIKKQILAVIDNPTFWKVVDKINWQSVMGEKSEKTKKRLRSAINQIDRYEKLNKIENRKFKDTKITIEELRNYYNHLLNLLNFYFRHIWLSDAVSGPSDDGYWDLRSSIIGFGKEFLIKIINDDQVFIDMVNNHNYAENFGYIFNQ